MATVRVSLNPMTEVEVLVPEGTLTPEQAFEVAAELQCAAEWVLDVDSGEGFRRKV
jgi:hypothetical protein